MEQILYFLSDDPTRIEFHIVQEAPGCWSLDSRFNPRRDPDVEACTDVEDLANTIEVRARSHFADHGSRLNRIELRYYAPIDVPHLARYGVSILPIDTGKR
jgi:hypothetical protein